MADESAGREVLFEMMTVGGTVRVVAIDAATGIEVTVMGPLTAPRWELQRLAMRKLERRLAQEGGGQGGGQGGGR
ncbi:serine hydroxymethyltransferase [Rhodoplanes sp. TEM]|uniref:Serine hydroxymethyltransferase n=1 Tax=Rhodoplanes tepidamans TaxID=200616 RepID=A0ABT5J9Z4_RHOTP|nr:MULTISPECIES: serine hydroxymethyltransferase [Rhodoplanes]MDC7786475.1 serine hydroxymethyltransferase [Rhodoplanes tepidamans]MDC7985474.1 serine hydroxymethyltransferase [Rhodoplanes sp. TEM]MDQ0357360.1 hypothetical protein [Rhodoplanes tepidamans]